MASLAERGIKFSNKWAKLKNGMTAETWNDLKPKRGKEYDESRALEYMRVMTGKEYNAVVWAVCDAGIKRVRYVTIMSQKESIWDAKKRVYVNKPPETLEIAEIPHWDFNPKILVLN